MSFPNEGIDKITLLLHPYMYGYIQGNIKIRKDNKIILYNDQKIVLYKEINSGFIYMTVQCEFIDLCADMRFTLTNALVRLISNGIVLFGGNEYPDLRYAFIYNYLESFIWLIHDIEFYFNFPRACIEIDEDENDPDIPDSEKELIHVGTTIYSPDFKKKERTSSIILYDKEHELRVKNQSRHTELENHTRPLRIEFKLYKNNSKYLSLENLKGNYSDIMERFTPHLASLYTRYFYGYVYVNSTDTPYFNKIYTMAKSGKTRCRGNLKKYDASENKRITKKETEAKWTMLMMLFKSFIRDRNSDKSDDGMNEC
jgi:hypothetical protein